MRKVCLLLPAVLLCSFLLPLNADAKSLKENEIKAAFLYQFTKFVQLPPEALQKETFTICVLGRDPFGNVLDQLENEKVDTKQVRVLRIRKESQIEACQLLYVSPSESGNLDTIMESLQDKPVLSVSEMDGFLPLGGMINFVKKGNRIRFEINQKDAEKRKIKISSKLLNLALKVFT